MRRVISAVFLILGTVLLLGTTAGVLRSLDAPAALLSTPDGAEQCAGDVIDALSRGDLPAAQRRIYGLSQPSEPWQPSDEAGALIWQAYLDSITCESAGYGYTTQTGMAWNVTVSTLDLAKVTEQARSLLAEQEAGGEPSRLQAAEAAILKEEDRIVRELQLNLVQTDGTWYVLPDAQLLGILSGNLKE